MPKGVRNFYSLRGDDCKYKDEKPYQEFSHMYISKFFVEPATSKDEFFYVKYDVIIAGEGQANTYYYIQFGEDYPIEEIIKTINDSLNINNEDSQYFSVEITGAPSWQNQLRFIVNNVGTKISFYATTGLAYKMGLEPGKVYETSSIIRSDYNTITKNSIYYDLKFGSKTVARYHSNHAAEDDIIYPVYMKSEYIDPASFTVVCDDRTTHHDVASTFEVVYLNSNVNFRFPRFTERSEDLIKLAGKNEAGLRNLSIFDCDHYIPENETFLTLVKYNTLFDPLVYQLTNNFELALIGNPNIINYPQKANVDGYILISATQTVNGAFNEFRNCTWMPIDINGNVLEVEGYNKPVRNFLFYNSSKLPKKYEYYSIENNKLLTTPGTTPPIENESRVVQPGYTNDDVLITINSFSNVAVNRDDITGELLITANLPFLIFGPRAVQHYLQPLPCILNREKVYSELVDTNSFSVITDTYKAVQVNYRTPKTIFYRVQLLGQNYYLNNLDKSYEMLWYKDLRDVLVPRDFLVTAHDIHGNRLYTVDDFSFEVLFR